MVIHLFLVPSPQIYALNIEPSKKKAVNEVCTTIQFAVHWINCFLWLSSLSRLYDDGIMVMMMTMAVTVVNITINCLIIFSALSIQFKSKNKSISAVSLASFPKYVLSEHEASFWGNAHILGLSGLFARKASLAGMIFLKKLLRYNSHH